MQQEIRFATFNVCNLAPPGARLYDNLAPLTADEYAAKVAWTAAQLDQLDADVIGLQEIFSLATLRDVLAHSRRYRDAVIAGIDADPAAERLTPQVALVSRLPRRRGAAGRQPRRRALRACAAARAGVAAGRARRRRHRGAPEVEAAGLSQRRRRQRPDLVRAGASAFTDPPRHRGGGA